MGRYVSYGHYGWDDGRRPDRQENADFVFKGGLAFPKALNCGSYRTPSESPYGYGAHVIRGPIKAFKGKGLLCDYDDRLRQFYPDKWERARRHLDGQFKYTSMSKLSLFLGELYGFPVECLQVVEGCNVSNGYPYFIFISKRVDQPEGEDRAHLSESQS